MYGIALDVKIGEAEKNQLSHLILQEFTHEFAFIPCVNEGIRCSMNTVPFV